LRVEEALNWIESGHHVVTSMAAAEPILFWQNFHERAKQVSGVTVQCANPSAAYPCLSEPQFAEHVRYQVMFLTAAIRRELGHGMVHYLPQHLSKWVANLRRNQPVDVFWGSCTPPDRRGFVSLGVGACYETEVLRLAKRVVLEVNPNMPVTYGATTVALDHVDALIDSPHELATLPTATITSIDRTIGSFVAELVPDGSTIQLGIGAIPNAIAQELRVRRDLGIHTELINDAILDLVEHGAVTGCAKTIWPEKIVGSFAFGAKSLYDFIDQNPMVEFQPSSVVNDPYRIGRNHRMISINSAVEIDLTGQVCSESIGHSEISGVGGASDTHTGAQRSIDGRGIVAMHATTDDEAFSKITFELRPGAKVSISRNDIDTVVTEYGVAQLLGRSTAQRVEALVAIAHPKFRDQLLFEARRVGYI
jgi:acyl-CoA hydrolase